MAPMIGPTRQGLIARLTALLSRPRLPITLAVMEPQAVVKREGDRWIIRALIHDAEAERAAGEAALASGQGFMPEHTWQFMREGDLLADAGSRWELARMVRYMDGAGLFPWGIGEAPGARGLNPEVRIVMERPFSPSCERNRGPILGVLRGHLPAEGLLLEIGSGTGQHAVYLAPEFPQLVWQTSELPENHPGILAWLEAEEAPNIRPPVALDVTARPWPIPRADAIFTANTTHYMPEAAALALLEGAAALLDPGGIFLLYGPFNYGGRFTSESNARFDGWLKARDPRFGVRDFEMISGILEEGGLSLVEDHEMPANNRTLVFERRR